MKITEKIVTSVTLPQLTNVLWHNPETGELKMFGNKGWEVVGGNPGGDSDNDSDSSSLCSGTCGGYPIVDVHLEDGANVCVLRPNAYTKVTNDEPQNTIYVEKLNVYDISTNRNFCQLVLDRLNVPYSFLNDGLPIIVNMDIAKYIEENVNIHSLPELTFLPMFIVKVDMGDLMGGSLAEYSHLLINVLDVDDMRTWNLVLIDNNPIVAKVDKMWIFMNDEEIPAYLSTPSYFDLYDCWHCAVDWLGDVWFKPEEEILYDNVVYTMVNSPMVALVLDMFDAPLSSKIGISNSHPYVTMFIYNDSNEIVDAIRLLAFSYITWFLVEKNVTEKEEPTTLEYIVDGVFTRLEFEFPVQWTNDNPPTFDGTTRHVISILDGVGCYTVTSIEETT